MGPLRHALIVAFTLALCTCAAFPGGVNGLQMQEPAASRSSTDTAAGDGRLAADPSTRFHFDITTAGALTFACICALLANSAGVGGGPFYMPLFNSGLGFSLNSATALSHTVVASSAIASTVYGMLQRSPVDPKAPLVDFSLALMFIPALLVGTGIGVIFNTLVPGWLQTVGLVVLLSLVIYKTGMKAKHTWDLESRAKDKELADEEKARSKAPPAASEEVALAHASDEELSVHHHFEHGLYKEVVEELSMAHHWLEMHGGVWGCLERATLSLLPLFQIIVLWVLFLGFKLAMTRSKKCAWQYFAWWGGQTLLCACVTGLMVYLQMRQIRRGEEMDVSMRQLLLGSDGSRNPKDAARKLLEAVGIMIFAGATAGLLGIGGALIFNPFLLAMGVHPQVTASTAVLMILFSSGSISLSFYFQGMLNTSYAAVFAPTCFVASLLGVTLIGQLIKQTGRASIIIIILTCLITLGTLLTAIGGGITIVKDLQESVDLGFKDFCA